MIYPYIHSGSLTENYIAPDTKESLSERDSSLFLTNRRVLIVEDEGITQLQLRKILSRAGLKVVGIASSGEQGVELALQERPEIILMDINMPGAYNGMEAAKRILSMFDSCIIFMTAYTDYFAEAKNLGASGYIVKPLDGQSLIPQLQLYFQQYHQQGN